MIIPGVVAHASRPVPTVTTGAATNTTSAPTVTTNAASNFNQNSATLNGYTSKGTLSYLYGTSTNPTTSTGSSLTSLSNGTTYYFRAVGVNTSATASVAGTITTTSPTTISFEYGTTSGVYTNETGSAVIPSGTNITVSAPITGLTPGSTYYFRIKASTTTGFVYGDQNSFTAVSASAQGSVLSFTTYSYRTVSYTSVGASTWYNPVPNSGTSGAAITSIYDCLIIGGGGNGFYGGGGGGGQGRLISSIAVGSTVSVFVGGSTQSSSLAGETAVAGQSSPGGDGETLATADGGASGNGYAGGLGFYTIFTGEAAGGGGGGAGANGSNSGGNVSSPGAGGSGTVLDGYGFGGGGGGTTHTNSINAAGGSYGGGVGNGSGAANTGGGGGGYYGSGGSGYVRFRYWGP